MVNVCALGIGNATYLKDFKVKLGASSVSPPSLKFNVIMNKGTMYKVTVCNADGYAGEAVVKLMENAKTLGTNLRSDGTFVNAVGFPCAKTALMLGHVDRVLGPERGAGLHPLGSIEGGCGLEAGRWRGPSPADATPLPLSGGHVVVDDHADLVLLPLQLGCGR